jgi:hypothetical protein
MYRFPLVSFTIASIFLVKRELRSITAGLLQRDTESMFRNLQSYKSNCYVRCVRAFENYTSQPVNTDMADIVCEILHQTSTDSYSRVLKFRH